MQLAGSDAGIGKSIAEFVSVALFALLARLIFNERPNGLALAAIALSCALPGAGLASLRVKRVPPEAS